MTKALLLFVVLFLSSICTLQAENSPAVSVVPGQSGTIIVHMTALKNLEGMVGVSLFNTSKGFPGKHDQAYAKQLKKITASTDMVVFENLPYGTYAVSVLHDENSNGKLDTTFLIGIPKEGIGVSNNPKIGRGAPQYKDCMFTLDTKEVELTIPMRYF